MTKINIKYNKFLDPIFKVYALSLPKYKDWQEPTMEQIEINVKLFKEAWKPINDIVISAIEKLTSKPFQYSIVDVAILSAVPRPFSNPIVFSYKMSTDEFICRLIHELIHKTEYPAYPSIPYFKPLYPNEPDMTLSHIYVHSMLKHIYLEVLKRPELMEVEMKMCAKHSTNDYIRAWELSEKHQIS